MASSFESYIPSESISPQKNAKDHISLSTYVPSDSYMPLSTACIHFISSYMPSTSHSVGYCERVVSNSSFVPSNSQEDDIISSTKSQPQLHVDDISHSDGIRSRSARIFHVDRSLHHYGRNRKAFLLSRVQLEESCSMLCCTNACMAKLGVRKLAMVREHYLGMNREEQDYYLKAAMAPLTGGKFEYYIRTT